MPQIPEILSTAGYATVGNGSTSRGNFDLSRYGSQIGCIMDALSQSPGIVLGAGTWQPEGPITMTGTGRVLGLGAGAVLRNCASGSVGIASISGQRNRIVDFGGKIEVSNWVNGQSLFSFTSGANFCAMKDLFVDVTTTAGNTSTPMNMVDGTSGINLTVDGFTCLPNTGVRVFNFTTMNSVKMSRISVRTDSATFGVNQRACYEVLRSTGCRYLSLTDFEVLALGTLTTAELNRVIVVQGNPNLTAAQGDYVALRVRGLTVESVAAPQFLSILGAIGYNVSDFRLANALGAIAVNGEAAIFIDSEDGNTSVGVSEANICGVARITDGTFESCAVGTGNPIYMKNGKKIDVASCEFHLPTGGPRAHILLNSREVRSSSVTDCRFDGDNTNTLYGVELECKHGTTGATVTPPSFADVSIRNNRGSGLLYGVCPARDPYFAGSTFADGSTYDDGSIFAGASYGTSARQPLTDATGASTAGIIDVPTVTTLNGTASGSANYAASIVVSAINRAAQSAGTFNFNLKHNSGSPAGDGTIDAVSTPSAAEFNAAIQEIEKVYNTWIDAPKTQAGRITLMKTMVNGAHTAGAIQKLIDNSGGSASATGTVGPISSSGTSAKDAIATMAQALGISTNTLGMLDFVTISTNTCVTTAQGT